MKKLIRYLILLFLIIDLTSCSKKAHYTTKVVKPLYYHRYYDRKKDRHTQRTQRVRVQN